ncbi:MAG: rod shape-determining protein RodA [Patescibacteria group bacterium]
MRIRKPLNKLAAKIDLLFLVSVFVLVLFGLVEIWSTDPQLAQKQLQVALGGVLLAGLLVFLDPFYVRLISPLLFVGSLLFLGAVALFSSPVRGASRWLSLGPLSFQPSEFIKLTLIFILAFVYSEKRLKPLHRFLIGLVLLCICVLLVVLQPDLGTGLILIAIWGGVSLAGGTPLVYLLILAFTGLVSLPVVWEFIKPYQRERIISFLNPRADPLGSGYNVLQAIIATGSGELLGRGLGRGPQSQLRYLPERSTDFIFASLAEEWGLFGCTILIFFYFVLLYRILITAREASSSFGLVACVGVFFMLLSQFFVNVGMNIGIMPITGLPLPLLSAGGSAFLVTIFSLGFVASVYLHRN